MKLRKTVKNPDPKQFEKELKLAINEGWKLTEPVGWKHGPHGTFKMAFLQKEGKE